MSPDRSLDDFLGTGEDAAREEPSEETESAEQSDGTHDEAPTDSGSPDSSDAPTGLAVRPATSTMDWTPGGAPCAGCGATVERRWRDEAELVCVDCKEW